MGGVNIAHKVQWRYRNGEVLDGQKRGRILRSCSLGATQHASHCSGNGHGCKSILTQLDATSSRLRRRRSAFRRERRDEPRERLLSPATAGLIWLKLGSACARYMLARGRLSTGIVIKLLFRKRRNVQMRRNVGYTACGRKQ
jgi:hypothetical protein